MKNSFKPTPTTRRAGLQGTGKLCCKGDFLIYSGPYAHSFLPLFVCVIHLWWYCLTAGTGGKIPRVRPSSGSRESDDDEDRVGRRRDRKK